MKKILIISFFISSIFFNTVAQAQDCSGINPDDIQPGQILCPIYRIFNAAILLAGIALVIVIAIGAIKMGLAFGSPDKLNQSVEIWKYGVAGFLVIVGAVSIYLIITSALGISTFSGFGDIQSTFNGYMNDLMEQFVLK